MQAMLDFAVKSMKTGAAMQVETIEAGGIPEGRYGDPLGAIAAAHPDVSIGSYPSYRDGRFNNQIVVRGKDESAVAAAKARGRGHARRVFARRRGPLRRARRPPKRKVLIRRGGCSPLARALAMEKAILTAQGADI